MQIDLEDAIADAKRLRVLDLFSGIGGFSRGLERAGMRTVAFCEIEPYCRAVLKKHWPEVSIYEDVRALSLEGLAADGLAGIDVICGGFPCQDISIAGKGAGLSGKRSGLWHEFHRLIAEIRPAWVVIENVAVLRSRGLEVILGQLAALGYDAQWHCISASAVGARHRRDRLWIVAYTKSSQRRSSSTSLCDVERQSGVSAERQENSGWAGIGGEAVADANEPSVEIGESLARYLGEELAAVAGTDWWLVEPDVGRVAHGVPARVDRLKSLGNAVVPQIPEIIGRAIVACHAARNVGNGVSQ